jgi:hypothetical protein
MSSDVPMNISHPHRFVFLAVPRTGSRITFKTLQRYGCVGGAPSGRMTHEMAVPRGCEDYLHVATVRSPFTRWVSCWVWCKRWPLMEGAPHQSFVRWLRENPGDFRGFVERATNARLIRTVSAYLNQVPAQHMRLLRYEHLQDDFRALPFIRLDKATRAAQSTPVVPLRHNPETKIWRSFFSDHVAQMVVQHSKADFDAFGYSENINDHPEIT